MKESDQPLSRRDLLRGAGVVLALPFLHQALPGNAIAGEAAPPAGIEPENAEATYRGRWHDRSAISAFITISTCPGRS